MHQLAAHCERAAHRWKDANVFRPSSARTRYVDAWVGRVCRRRISSTHPVLGCHNVDVVVGSRNPAPRMEIKWPVSLPAAASRSVFWIDDPGGKPGGEVAREGGELLSPMRRTTPQRRSSVLRTQRPGGRDGVRGDQASFPAWKSC